MIPLPRPWALTGAMLVGCTLGMLAAVSWAVWVDVYIRPDTAIALVVGVPSVLGLVLLLVSNKRWVTTLGAFILALAPGWLAALVALQVATHG